MKPTKTNPEFPSKSERHRHFGSVDPIHGNKPTTKEGMTDLQNQRKDYLFTIDRVGICRVRHPVQVRSELTPALQTSIATISMATSLNREYKGINMSRLTEQLERYRQEGRTTDLMELYHLTQELAERMDQHKAEITIIFPWFYERPAPISKQSGLNHAEASIHVIYEKQQSPTITIGLRVAVTTLCPCSKEISEYSAHNQRGTVTIKAEIHPHVFTAWDWKVALLEAAESNASSALHPVLKRPDEKRVTEQAYENPRFVEDMVRLVAADLYEMNEILAFSVECQNEESIHLHDAFAAIHYDKRAEEATH